MAGKVTEKMFASPEFVLGTVEGFATMGTSNRNLVLGATFPPFLASRLATAPVRVGFTNKVSLVPGTLTFFGAEMLFQV